ncbi:uncharacterized protein N0V89_005833 [Didymosphaeria variabile]|uniref:Aspartate kinase FUB3 n=1 Tax=Didymosphaeria variabile TaxID=1932322 RepID=A0A9W8XLG7_9PLEO|nr:uncharacterized protein N0V89_005833 [Didymosphaeria variabile]KAJ4354100.1 hypothetical protein N0V89_005833 [Didymosphaeria variabile]
MATAVAPTPSKGLQRRFKGCSKIGEYELLKKLGEGTFGEVHQARHVRSGRIFAMKKILTHNEKDGFPITALREIKLLKMLSHENVLKLEEMSVERPKAEGRKRAILYMVMPYMDHDLSGLLDNPDVHFSAPQVKCYMLQLFKGLRYLHDNHILHRDMKAANLLINNRGRLQIADFGLARHYDEPVPQRGKGNGEARRDYTTLVVTRWYRPPELLLQLRRYTPAIDMWGAGCVFGEMFKRKPILAGQSDLHQAQIIFELVGSPNDRSMPGWNQLPGAEPVRAFASGTGQLSQRFRELSPQGLDLLSKLLMLDWRKRINAIDAIDHPYFKEEPRPMREEDIPTFADSHELDRRNARGQKQHLPPAPAGDVTVHPTEDRLGLIDHEETTTVGHHPRQDMESADRIGAVMEQTSLCLLRIRPAMVKVVTVGTATATGTGTGALRPEILIFLHTMDRDPERNVDPENLTTGRETVGVDPEILVTREMALPMNVRTVAGVTETGTEQEIRATLDETGAMVGHVHEVQIEETGHASETETFTGDRVRIAHTEEKHLPGGWVVLKFGGTSVGKFAENIAAIVRNGLSTNRAAIVCSARSGTTKLEGTTNRLLRCARAAERAGSRAYDDVVEALRVDHIQAAKDTLKDAGILAKFEEEVNAECEGLVKILESAQHLEEVTSRAEDKIVSKGEKLSCRYMAALLNDRGTPAQYVDVSEVFKSPSHAKGGMSETFYTNLAEALGKEVEACGDKVPVITGFFGNVAGGILSAVGRGYTDLCAALVAVGIKADELQIWKEVDGIFTADPRKVPTARLLPSVTPSEAAELTFYGSEVIHPFTMEQVIRARIPIRIKNVMNPRGNGTIIFPDRFEDEPGSPTKQTGLFRTRSSSLLSALQRPKRPTAVTIKHNVIVLNVHSNKRTRAHGFLMNIFSILDRWHLSVDLISSSEVHVSMALHSESALLSGGGEDEYKIKNKDLHGAIGELGALGAIDIVPDMAIVSLVGKQLKNMIGISGRFFSVLGDNNINIEMISQGASEINISCVIEEREADRALNVVHTNLFTFLE